MDLQQQLDRAAVKAIEAKRAEAAHRLQCDLFAPFAFAALLRGAAKRKVKLAATARQAAAA